MKLVRQAKLFYQEARSDKVYEVDLCEVGDGEYVVNFRYGRRGTDLRDGTKTPTPVALAKAEKSFESLVTSKRKKGYRESGEAAASADAAVVEDEAAATAASEVLLERLRQPPRKDGPPLSRTIWRVGERRLRQAVPQLVELARSKSEMERYCVAWALGRCAEPGDPGTLGALEALAGDSAEAVRRIALFALGRVVEDRRAFAERAVGELPPAIAEAVRAGDAEAVLVALRLHLNGADPEAYQAVETLYLAAGHPAARTALLAWVREASLAPPAFQRLRHLYKAAEMGGDAELFGLLAYRFETGRAMVSNYGWTTFTWLGGRYVEIGKELKSKRSRLAFPSRTRDYLRARTARTLRRLGELGDEAYIPMALGALLPFTDRDAREPREVLSWDWEEDREIRTWYDAYNPYLALSFILYRHSPRYHLPPPGRFWRCQPNYRPGRPAPAVREEAFPRLWDAQPRALLHLLSDSACAPVHEFAARALAANREFLDEMPVDAVAMMLSRPYEPTARLGLDVARRRWDPAHPDVDLVRALLGASLDEARELARQWVSEQRTAFLGDASFLVDLALHRYPDVRSFALELLRSSVLPPSLDAKALVARLLAAVLALTATEEDAAVAADAAEVLIQAFGRDLRDLGLNVVRDLIRHPLARVQALGGRILLDHQTPAEQLPGDLLRALLEAESPEVRSLGVRLMAELPPAVLVVQEELVLAFCVSEAAEIRQAARSILARLAPEHPRFAEAIAAALAVRLMRKERQEGLHRDVLAMIREDLKPALPSFGVDMVLRLLWSRSSAAHVLGSQLLDAQVGSAELSVRQTARLARHEMKAVRDAGWQRLAEDMERTAGHLGDALTALDSEWEDSREQGFAFFRERFGAEQWTPTLLVSVCDSVRHDVARFGRELVSRFFEEEHGPEYLLKLSQHPSADVQLFATNYLERFASGRPERIVELEGYFLSVLSKVNRGRVAKDRIFSFLRREALAERATAERVVPLLERLSLTVAIGDKATCIAILRDVAVAFPDLPSPIRLHDVEKRPSLRKAG